MTFEDIIREGNQVKLKTEHKPHNENDKHYLKKLIFADHLKQMGDTGITFEDSENYLGLRFDLTAKTPNGQIEALEAGQFNCRSSDLIERLRDSYEAGVEVVYWWPHRPLHKLSPEMEYFRPEIDSSCFERSDGEEGMCKFFGSYSKDLKTPGDINSGNIIMIDLFHLFEPRRCHEEHEKLGDNE